ncbi:MAG: hypothetical protein ACI9JN_001612 [Bacteroidia bacterium]|jgi:hypothetical protein
MSEIKTSSERQAPFAKAWFRFLRECRASGVKMNQSIAAKQMKIKRSTYSYSVNYGPSDTVLLRFSRFTGIPPELIDESLADIKPIMLHKNVGYCEPLKKAS